MNDLVLELPFSNPPTYYDDGKIWMKDVESLTFYRTSIKVTWINGGTSWLCALFDGGTQLFSNIRLGERTLLRKEDILFRFKPGQFGRMLIGAWIIALETNRPVHIKMVSGVLNIIAPI